MSSLFHSARARIRPLLGLVAAIAAATSLSAVGFVGCGSPSSGAEDRCALKGEGCECGFEGQTVECADTVSTTAEAVTCLSGTRTCSGGHWGACVGSHSTIQSWPTFSTRSSTPIGCTDNPCDPGCMTFDDEPEDVDGGAVPNEDGGLTLSEIGDGNPDVKPCTGIACNIQSCGGVYTRTQVTGKVYDPAGKNPVYNVLVYVPNSSILPLVDGVSSEACSTGSGDPIVSALTDYTGTFTLKGVPTGTNIPIVIQSGKWRRQLTLPSVTKCVSNSTDSLVDSDSLPLLRFPKNRSEGDLPRIAFVSGSADPFQCVLTKMGLDASTATGEVGHPIDKTVLASTTAIPNGGFESGLTSWTATGLKVATTTVAHTGTTAVQLGNPLAPSADNNVAQTFTAPALGGNVSFWYRTFCTTSTSTDYSTATLQNLTTGAAAVTILAKTCTNTGWVQVTSAALVAGNSYKLVLANHDNNTGTTGFTYTNYDDVVVSSNTISADRIHYYQGTSNPGQNLDPALGGPAPTAATLYDTADHLNVYDAVILSCEGGEYNKGAAVYQNLSDYTNRGGRIFATHFSYEYMQAAPAATDWPNVVQLWNHQGSPASPMTTVINQTFTKGDNFAKWLNFVGASPTLGQLAISEGRHDYDYVDLTRTTPWMYSNADGTALAPNGSLCQTGAECTSTSCTGTSVATVPVNPSFESDLASWTPTGTAVTVSLASKHAGLKSVQLGLVTPTTDNTVSQTFTAPAVGGTLSFWFLDVCRSTVTYDYVKATLKNNTTGTTATMANTCSNTGVWAQVTYALVASNSYTLTFTNHDDNSALSTRLPSYSYWDDVTVIAKGTCSNLACTANADCGTAVGAACWNGRCVAGHNMEPLFTFNTPVAAATQYGRVVYSDFHVSASALGSGGSTFPTGCLAGDLSAQEKALEFMLFDLTACVTPDYVPPPPPPKYTSATVTRDYVATCPAGYASAWHFFDWQTHTPSDSSIDFTVQTGDTAAAVSAMTPLPLATVSGAPVTSWTGVDVATKFAATAPPTKNGKMLRVTFKFNPSTDGLSAPVLDAWRQAYTCVAVE